MISAIQRRMAARQDEDKQSGFTLIELMVVVMIIAILVGIAIPAFLGARKRAQDTAAKSNLRNALGTAQTIFTDNQAYLPVAGAVGVGMVATLAEEEPSFSFVANTVASDTAKEISVLTEDSGITGAEDDMLTIAAESDTGKCHYVRHVATSGTNNLSGSYYTTLDDPGAAGCTADSAPAADAVDAADPVWKAL